MARTAFQSGKKAFVPTSVKSPADVAAGKDTIDLRADLRAVDGPMLGRATAAWRFLSHEARSACRRQATYPPRLAEEQDNSLNQKRWKRESKMAKAEKGD
ncbi:MAG: hypothetical protein HY904_24485 [Deltaproteobacteria bacterium]|nr:hypothetical protein [Deltaproteobacteria bacterium]